MPKDPEFIPTLHYPAEWTLVVYQVRDADTQRHILDLLSAETFESIVAVPADDGVSAAFVVFETRCREYVRAARDAIERLDPSARALHSFPSLAA